MQMGLRWYGAQFDTVTLTQIRQIPGVSGVITTLYDTAPGDVWPRERIDAMKAEVEAAGLRVLGIESVNVHDDIKAAGKNRDQYIEHYIQTLENLGRADIRMVCYNFMPVFGLPRIVTGGEKLLRLMRAVDSPCNGVTLCTGSLASNPDNDVPAIIRSLKGRIPFAHVRNIRRSGPRDFEEAAHLSADGSLDMYEIIRALYETGFDGVIRPDHGRMIWNEQAMPGYGLYDRALGACYLSGLWEAVDKAARR